MNASDLVIGRCARSVAPIGRLTMGLTWTTCVLPSAVGIAMTPAARSRVLSWPGTVAGRRAGEVAGWLASSDEFEAAAGLAAANAVINAPGNAVMGSAAPLASAHAPNLAVFEHFRERLTAQRVAVIGRYPGMDEVLAGLDVTVLELAPSRADLPAEAADVVLPEADWVFLTATTLINKTFERLAALSRDATTVLMGPSTPWLEEWAGFGIDYLAGVQVVNREKVEQIAAEGGGTRLFGAGVRYAIADLRTP